jgi:uncharacterized protein (DUF2147 family)
MRMKIIFATALLTLAVIWALPANAQSKADKIVGYYLTYDDETNAEKSQVQIYKDSNGKYYGKIVWLKEPTKNGKPKVDEKNPDAKLQKRALIGLEILKGFKYDKSSDEWVEGTIYNPASGKTYNCYINFESATKVKIRGYIGASWMGLGKTAYWTKEAGARK